MHSPNNVRERFLIPSLAFPTHPGDNSGDRLLLPPGKNWTCLLMPMAVYGCVHTHLPQVKWAGRTLMTRSFTFKGRDMCTVSGPRMFHAE